MGVWQKAGTPSCNLADTLAGAVVGILVGVIGLQYNWAASA